MQDADLQTEEQAHEKDEKESRPGFKANIIP
jgi:hypothetical protein